MVLEYMASFLVSQSIGWVSDNAPNLQNWVYLGKFCQKSTQFAKIKIFVVGVLMLFEVSIVVKIATPAWEHPSNLNLTTSDPITAGVKIVCITDYVHFIWMNMWKVFQCTVSDIGLFIIFVASILVGGGGGRSA